MKPIKIELSAFGSYQQEVIDFSDVQQGIFLITGNTGSGKTTIFDAISYALFNETSGGERDGEMMCSQYVKKGTETKVVFEFSSNGEVYKIIRSPKQHKWKKKTDEDGNEYYEQLKTDKQATVELILPDGQSYPGKNAEVDTKILEIIRLSAKQFTQVAMMSQGDFVKLLKAPSKDRKTIFASIFDTKFYGLMEQEFKNLERDMNTKLEENSREWERAVDQMICIRQSELSEEFDLLKDFSESRKEEIVACAKQILEESQEEKILLEKERKVLQKQLDEVKQNLSNARHVNETFVQLEEQLKKKAVLESKQEEIQQQRQRAELGAKAEQVERYYAEFQHLYEEKKHCEEELKKLEAWQKDNEQILLQVTKKQAEAKKIREAKSPELNAMITRLQDALPQYEILEKVLREKIDNQQQLSQKNKQKEQLQIREERRKKELEEEKKKIEDYQKQQGNLELFEHQKKTLEDEKKDLEKLKEVTLEWGKIQSERKECKEHYNKLEETIKQNRKRYDALYQAFLNNQAAILAEGLEEGQPCPVCGNTHHLRMHVKKQESVEKKQVEDAKKQIDAEEKQQQDYYKKWQEYESKLNALKELSKALLQRGIVKKKPEGNTITVAFAEELLQSNLEQRKELEQQEKKALEVQKLLEISTKKKQQLEEQAEAERKETEQTEKQLREFELKQARLEEQADSLQKQLKGTKQEAENNLLQKKQELEQIEKTYQEAENEKKKAEEEKQLCLGKLDAERKNEVRIQNNGKEAQNQLYEKLKEQNFASLEEFKQSRMPHAEIEKLQHLVESYEREKIANQKNIELLEKQTEGKQKIRTEEYEKRAKEMTEKAEQIREEENEVYTAVSMNRETVKTLKYLKEQRDEFLKKYEILSNLDKTANGKLSGKHLNFQTYILRKYFKEVIYRANKKLRVMSNGQFILQCKEIQELSGQGEAGLDLNVYSLVNDESRDVKSLSGGECFMAALSMELGLSEMIQQSVGSVKVETMFIDEGFGSLDDSSRNQAIRILNDLSGSNRLIGIISHVTELKSVVETKLEVTKTEKGSTAKWVRD